MTRSKIASVPANFLLQVVIDAGGYLCSIWAHNSSYFDYGMPRIFRDQQKRLLSIQNPPDPTSVVGAAIAVVNWLAVSFPARRLKKAMHLLHKFDQMNATISAF